MSTLSFIARQTMIYTLVFTVFYCTSYLLTRALPIDLNPPIQLTCPPGSPGAHAT